MRAAKRGRGRPCELTAKVEKAILAAVGKGVTLKHAAMVAGISYDTLNRWRNIGEQPDAPQKFCNFCNALKKAEGKAVSAWVGRINQASCKTWQAAAWMLERCHPEEWGKKSPTEQHSPQPPPPMFAGMSLEHLQEELPMHSVIKIMEECMPRLKAKLAADGGGGAPKIETGFKSALPSTPFL